MVLKKLGLLVLVILLSGCGAKEEKITNCTISGLYSENMSVKANYKITSKGKYVTFVESTEEMAVFDDETRKDYYNKAQEQASFFKNIEYYDAYIDISDKTIRSVVTIDYAHINMNDLLKVNPMMKDYLKNGKIKVDDMIEAYKNIGASCS